MKRRAFSLIFILVMLVFSLLAIKSYAAIAGDVGNMVMKASSSGATLVEEQWTNSSVPYFSWEPGAGYVDSIGGYCLYIGASDSLSPQDSKGLLGNSGVTVGSSTCPFAYVGTSIDLATVGYRGGTWLTSSASLYYFKVLALDLTGDPLAGDSAIFAFHFDNTVPNNPGYISLPGGFVTGDNVSFTWATSGGYAPSDGHSGLAGIQYRINSGTWYGDYHSGTQNRNDVLSNDGIYTLHATYDVPALSEGVNTVYIRTWDNAGNVTGTYVTGTLKINTTAPGIPQNLAVTPSTNTTNSYAFSWQVPTTYTGSSSNITYCYSVNILPGVASCHYTNAGVTSLVAGSYATIPGGNVMYVVARDEAGNINYDTYAEKAFSYTGTAPGIPLAIDVVDISVKSTSSWKLAVTWEAPNDVGAGVSSYKVYRSTNSLSCATNPENFSMIGTTPGNSFVDGGLTQQMYYYCVSACDSANSCSALSETAGRFPDGRYTEPAPLISGPSVSNISTRSAVVSWYTGRFSDSRIAYGLISGSYFEEEPASSVKTLEHVITLTGLEPATTYYAVIKWTDEDGNTGTSDEFSFITGNPPLVTNAYVGTVGLDYALVSFDVEKASSVEVQYGADTSIANSKTVSTSSEKATYLVRLEGLESGTDYYYSLIPLDSDGFRYYGTLLSFATLPRPAINDISIEPVADSADIASEISWVSNVAITSEVTYFAFTDPENIMSIAEADLITDHSIELPMLIPSTMYGLTIGGVDGYGNRVVSDLMQFTSATDTRAPKLSDIKITSQLKTLGQEIGGIPQAQVIISWTTDEPSTSQVEYTMGSMGSFSDRTPVHNDLRQNHMVVISGLDPASIYKFRVVSEDSSGNISMGTDIVVVTPKSAGSVNELIFGNLLDIFSFL